MQIKSIKITNFRNFEKYTLKPEKVNLLLGPNGVGKTNLLEAIYLLSVCRSYRTRLDREIVRWSDDCHSREGGNLPARQSDGDPCFRRDDKEGISGSDTARVGASLLSDTGDELDIAIAQAGDKKLSFVGEKQVPVSLMVGKLPAVLFAPEEMDLPNASPSKRRRDLNIFLSQLDEHYMRNLLEYNKILKARNKLIDGIASRKNKENELDFWDKQLVHFGKLILKSRINIIKEINKHIITSYNKIAQNNGDKRNLSIKYLSTIENIDRFDEELTATRDREIRYRSTIVGPHRDDWQLLFDGIDVRMSASRGETRAALLALKMAEMEILYHYRKELPVLLLDDVFAELDRHHSESLLEFIDGGSLMSPQIFITATDAEYIPKSIKKKAKVIKLC